MSKVLLGQKESDTRFDVRIIHNQPDKLDSKNKEKGIEVDDNAIPDKPETSRGETTSLFANPKTKELWYEVEERPLNPKEKKNKKLEELKKKIDKNQQDISDIKNRR